MPKVKLFDTTKALDAATQLFWEKGYHATSMQDLVNRMEISRQSLYDTFGNKQDLFNACLKQYQADAMGNTSQAFDKETPTYQLFTEFFEYMIDEIMGDDKNKCCFVMNTLVELVPEETDAKDIVTKNYAALENTFYSVLAKGRNNDDYISDFSTEDLTTHFIGVMHGLKLIGKINKNRSQLEGFVKTAMSVLRPQ